MTDVNGKKENRAGGNTNECVPMIHDRGLAWASLNVVPASLEQSARAGVSGQCSGQVFAAGSFQRTSLAVWNHKCPSLNGS